MLAEIMVVDFDPAVRWYGSFFGRPPDRRPMDGLVEWQLTDGGGLQLFRKADCRGGVNVTIAVDDVDAHLATLAERGISGETFDSPLGQLRLATLRDPEGNTITLAQGLQP
ncbi:MAG: VOC family protein [Actinomycetota bacterium]|nr:VOC family protein [Actinomycetota bacterium]